MPDPPTTEPLQEGQPEAKKQKLAPDNQEDEWEVVEKPGGPPADETTQPDSLGKGTATDDERTKTKETGGEQDSNTTKGGSMSAQYTLLED